MEKIGVVTVLFNSANVIKPFLECVISQQHTKFNLYIIDNNSQDNSLEILSNFSDPRIKLISRSLKRKEAVFLTKEIEYKYLMKLLEGSLDLLYLRLKLILLSDLRLRKLKILFTKVARSFFRSS